MVKHNLKQKITFIIIKMNEYSDDEYPTLQESNERQTQEDLRAVIRPKIDEKIKSSGYKEMTEQKKRQLRDEIRKEIMASQTNSIEQGQK